MANYKYKFTHYILAIIVLFFIAVNIRMLTFYIKPFGGYDLHYEPLSILEFIKINPNYLLFFLAGIISVFYLIFKKKIAILLSLLYMFNEVIHQSISRFYDWTYFLEIGSLVIFIVVFFYKKEDTSINLTKTDMKNYFLIIVLALIINYLPVLTYAFIS